MNADPRITEFLSAGPITDPDVPEPAAEPRTSNRHAQSLQRRPRVSAALDAERPALRVLSILDAVARRIRNQPLAAIAVAIGAGFVLGGALSFRAGRVLVTAGARHLSRELLKQLL